MKKPSIPTPDPKIPSNIKSMLDPIKENIEIITGRRAGSVDALDGSATTAQVIAKINEIIDRLQ